MKLESNYLKDILAKQSDAKISLKTFNSHEQQKNTQTRTEIKAKCNTKKKM